jgi:hypothetical protein
MLLTGLDTISPSTIAATMRDDVFRAYFMNGYGTPIGKNEFIFGEVPEKYL